MPGQECRPVSLTYPRIKDRYSYSPSILWRFSGWGPFPYNYLKPANSDTLECLSATTRELTNFVADTYFRKGFDVTGN